ncbi:hypothetical protein TNCV_1941121 [Trichonephila clavipes]|uniref:Uncharacterized protein n=1 Tax=Trichonephila clavipes TaxID=2585209 RepID=A0A8X6S8D9_TRICX|nr:hypothetical protein TNCV_1941121 [Trichonephila clavipes]
MVSWDYLWPTLRFRRVAGVTRSCQLAGCTSLRSSRRDTAVGLVLQIRGFGFTRWILALMLLHYILDSPLVVTPHRILNSCRGVISESDLLCASETEILEGLSDQGVIQMCVRSAFFHGLYNKLHSVKPVRGIACDANYFREDRSGSSPVRREDRSGTGPPIQA